MTELYLKSNDNQDMELGKIGTITPITYKNGDHAYVGDVVDCFKKETNEKFRSIVCMNPFRRTFVSGLAGTNIYKGKSAVGKWQIKKVLSYADLREEATVRDITVVSKQSLI